MRISWRFFLSLTLGLLLVTVNAQNDDKEESNIPRKVLRKYRIRRPQILDSNGNVVRSPNMPRLRRIRVNKAQLQSPVTPPPNNSLESSNKLKAYQAQQEQRQAALVQQQAFYDEAPQVIEPVRVVPTYRKPTPSSTRSELLANVNYKDRGQDDEGKKPAIAATRNYSRINEDGSFTFGYEGEDGSFKEETRGTDCVVRGKYGYVDPDGVRREFEYVSGNPCDPNNPDQDESEEDDYEEAIQQFPQRATISRPRRPVVTSNVEQNLYRSAAGTDEAVPSVARNVQLRQRARTEAPPTFRQPTTFRPRFQFTQPAQPVSSPRPIQIQQLQGRSVQSAFPSARPATQIIPQSIQSLEPRGANKAFRLDQALEEIQFQSQRQSEEPQPQAPVYQRQPQRIQPQQIQPQQIQPQRIQSQVLPQQIQQQAPQRFGPGSVHRFPHRQYFGSTRAPELLQQRQQITPTPPQLQQRPLVSQPPMLSNSLQEREPGKYRMEVVFDPATGRYTSVLVEDEAEPEEEFTLTQRLRGFTQPQRPQQFQFQSFQRPQVQYYQPQPSSQPVQAQYQQRPLFQNQYYNPTARSLTSLHADAQEAINSPAAGQIDAFLSNLNIRA